MLILIIAAVATTCWIIWQNLRRSRCHYHYDLRPNCLLTRYPLVFIQGRQSIFYFLRYWNILPQYLRDHGYEVIELRLPWRHPEARREALQDFHDQAIKEGRKFHFIGDNSCLHEVEFLKNAGHRMVQSLCVASRPNRVEDETSPKDLFPARIPIHELNLPKQKLSSRPKVWVWRLLLAIHNWRIGAPKGLTPQAVAIPYMTHLSSITAKFLNFAVGLAENDLKYSHD